MNSTYNLIIADRVTVVNNQPVREHKPVEKLKTRKKSKTPLERAKDRKRQGAEIAHRLLLLARTASTETEQADLRGRAARLRACNTVIVLHRCKHCGRQTVSNANLCRDRLCPTCQYLAAVNRYNELHAVINALGDKVVAYDWRLITLTIRNCPPDELSETMDIMLHAWDKVCKRRTVKADLRGWCRKVEITYNPDRRDMHPHIHVLTMWDKGCTPSISDVRDWWRSALDLDYDPICDVREPYSRDARTELSHAIIEAAKYTVKLAELPHMPARALRHLIRAITGRKLVSYGGEIRSIRRDLGLTSTERVDEVVSDRPQCCGQEMEELVAEWSFDRQQYDLIVGGMEAEPPCPADHKASGGNHGRKYPRG